MSQLAGLVERGEPSIADGPHSCSSDYFFPAITALSLFPSFPDKARFPPSRN